MTHSFKFNKLIQDQKHAILEEMNRKLGILPKTPYQDFLLRTGVGQSRLSTWLDMVLEALGGNSKIFLEDMEKAGYERAIQGFQLSNVSDAYQIFLETCLDIFQKNLSVKNPEHKEIIKEIKIFAKFCFEGYSEVAGSFLTTREEIINEKVSFLQYLLNFTKQMITVVDAESTIKFSINDISSFFKTMVFISLSRNEKLIHFQKNKNIELPIEIEKVIETVWNRKTTVFTDLNGEWSDNVDDFDIKRLIALPIGARGRLHGVLTLKSSEEGINFNHKNLDMLLQFNYIVAMALDKSLMVEEIEKNREELSLLSSEVITVGEEQRKLLAADIHDTIAQTLAGIGYKIQFCSEMLSNRPDLVETELINLQTNVDKTIKQTRDIMSNLHPILIETSGLIPALKKIINSYKKRTDIKVTENLPNELDVQMELSICIYRVVEEAIRNVEKHAEADSVRISLFEKQNEIITEITDNGKGYDLSIDRSQNKDFNTFGLLYMRQWVESVSGKLTINTAVGNGCSIKAALPSQIDRRTNGRN